MLLSDVIAVQALYKLSLNFIFHSSGDFNLKRFLENCVLFFRVKSLSLAQIEFSDELQTKNIL